MTEEKEILKKVSETVTEKPLLTFDVDIKPTGDFKKLHQWLIDRKLRPSKRYFIIKPQRVGNVYRIAGRAVSFNVDGLIDDKGNIPDELDKVGVLIKLMVDYGQDIFYIVAAAIQNDDQEPSEALIKIVRNEFEMLDLLKVLRVAVGNYNITAFIHTIALITGVDALKTKVSPTS